MKRGFRLLRELAVLAASLAFLAGVSFLAVRLFSGPSGNKSEGAPGLSIAIEARLRDFLRKYLLQHEKLHEEPAVTALCEAVGQRLLPGAGSLAFPVEIVVVDSPVVNALAFPGGLIVVYSGLLEHMEAPEELAAVVAHELGHVKGRDAMKALFRELGIQVVLSLASGHAGDTSLHRVVRKLVSLRYSRQAESAADAYGLELLVRTGIDPARFGTFLARLRDQKEGKTPEFFKYLDSHPDLEPRIEAAFNRSRQIRLQARFEERPLEVDWEGVRKAVAALR